jgi:hypothetical protein
MASSGMRKSPIFSSKVFSEDFSMHMVEMVISYKSIIGTAKFGIKKASRASLDTCNIG